MASTGMRMSAAIIAAALVTGCAGFREHRGYMMDEELVTAVQVGIDNKESVMTALGRPTFTGQFDDNNWYYLSQDTKIVPFRSAKVREQDLVHVQFDAAGNVVAVNRGDETTIVSIDPHGDKTPTIGRKRSFFDELFGNIGVFSSGAFDQTPVN